jgi:Rho-type GTPase-activating protein 1/2
VGSTSSDRSISLTIHSSGAEVAPSNLNRALTKRLDGLRSQYRHDLTALQQEHEHLNREITELKAVRDLFLEETATLNARNEELAQLSAVYTRRMDTIPETPMRNGTQPTMGRGPANYPQGLAPSLSTSTSSTSTIHEDPNDIRQTPTPAKKFKWIGSGSRVKDAASPSNGMEFSKSKAHIEHNFQQVSLLNLNTRCKHCGDKLWGSQLRCTGPSP